MPEVVTLKASLSYSFFSVYRSLRHVSLTYIGSLLVARVIVYTLLFMKDVLQWLKLSKGLRVVLSKYRTFLCCSYLGPGDCIEMLLGLGAGCGLFQRIPVTVSSPSFYRPVQPTRSPQIYSHPNLLKIVGISDEGSKSHFTEVNNQISNRLSGFCLMSQLVTAEQTMQSLIANALRTILNKSVRLSMKVVSSLINLKCWNLLDVRSG